MAGGTERLKDELFHQLTAYLEKLMVLCCVLWAISSKLQSVFQDMATVALLTKKKRTFFLHPCPSVRRPFAPNPSVAFFISLCWRALGHFPQISGIRNREESGRDAIVDVVSWPSQPTTTRSFSSPPINVLIRLPHGFIHPTIYYYVHSTALLILVSKGKQKKLKQYGHILRRTQYLVKLFNSQSWPIWYIFQMNKYLLEILRVESQT